MQIIEGGVTAAKGFKAAGMAAGIKYKNGKKDMAMVVSDKPCVTAGTFTLNRVFAAPVKWDKNIVYNEAYAQAIVVNSGVANACTGVEGDEACALEAKTAGEALGIPADAVLLGSTGVIGMQLPMDRMCAGIKARRLCPCRWQTSRMSVCGCGSQARAQDSSTDPCGRLRCRWDSRRSRR